jgi:hypothetical protein
MKRSVSLKERKLDLINLSQLIEEKGLNDESKHIYKFNRNISHKKAFINMRFELRQDSKSTLYI